MTQQNKFEILLSVSKHELGHWISAKSFNFNEDYIRILYRSHWNGNIYPDAYCKSFPQADCPDIESVYQYLENRIVCLQSGVASEFMISSDGKIDISKVEEAYKDSASNDNKQINELINIARGIRFAGEIDSKYEMNQKQTIADECWRKTEEIIVEHYFFISEMSKLMADELIMSTHGVKFERTRIEHIYLQHITSQSSRPPSAAAD
ncbi:hypothetical protein L3V43_17730 [Pseudoalteromonas sp. L23]|uniref:hypothetical protein n=1 Tax=unclassified Pseudoalteromonas TaxID=194690 RepID=UPI001EF07C6F|nr:MULTISPECIES: hypothetical protein [unclassified Pseudoalteromonas]MCF7515330.1 hypothetical protein [Pseudoalteromonas sp. L7]MCF7527491.1 hypothetical protein [Pseudoalteromonas sp. L23]MCX2767591.1 hypothetical protein [Pseudoalteromonas sp. B530]